MTEAQKKALLSGLEYTWRENGKLYRSRAIGFAKDHRGFGAIAGFGPCGKKFFVLNDHTMQVSCAGNPPGHGAVSFR